MPFFTSNGANIHVDVVGSGTPVLMVHGLTLDRRQWTPQREALPDHRMFRMDMRGHGRSATTLHGHNWAGMAADVRRALVQIGMERLNPGFLVAHGHTADAVLQTALAEPRAVRGVVVASPVVWGGSLSSDWQRRLRDMRQHAAEGNLHAALELYRADPIFDAVRGDADLEAAVDGMQEGFSGAYLRSDEPDHGTPTLERLERCTVPILILRPERDRGDLRAMASEIASRAARAHVVEMHGIGHFANLEDAESFNRVLGEFITETS